MTILTIILISFFVFMLAFDYASTRGYIKAKILHFIALTFLIYNHLSCFQWLVWVIIYPSMQEKINIQVGVIGGELNFFQNIIFIVLGVVILFSVFGMLNRKDSYRRILVRVLPFVIPSSAIAFYINCKQHGLMLDDYVLLLIGFIVYAILYLSIIFLYRSKLMVEFFKAKSAVIR